MLDSVYTALDIELIPFFFAKKSVNSENNSVKFYGSMEL